mmetsp:Transcript_588/g.1328  ORF Transcript_588/g.1328 Transcript_588/m.1328 type:complete len:109 (+) Transcript_588:4158-4484(+)
MHTYTNMYRLHFPHVASQLKNTYMCNQTSTAALLSLPKIEYSLLFNSKKWHMTRSCRQTHVCHMTDLLFNTPKTQSHDHSKDVGIWTQHAQSQHPPACDRNTCLMIGS